METRTHMVVPGAFKKTSPSSAVVVLVPRTVLCASDGYINASQAATRDAGEGFSWLWEALPENGSDEDVYSTVRAVLDRSPSVDVVIVPSFEVPFQATYYKRVSGGSSATYSATHVIPPYRKAYDTSVALCYHYSWRNIVILNSDDHFMSLAQGLRQKLSTSGVNVRRHQVFSPDAVDMEDSGRRIEFELGAIQSSGVRVIFLLAPCASSHAILTTARRLGMLRGYAWILLHPPALCPLAAVDTSSEVTTLETYQGVLGLSWSGQWSEETAPLTPRLSDSSPSSPIHSFCGNRVAPNGTGSGDGDGGEVMAALRRGPSSDPDFSGRFLYNSLMLYVNRHNHTSFFRSEEGPHLSEDRGGTEGSPSGTSVGVSVVSFAGARRKLSTGGNQAPLSIEAIVQTVAQLGPQPITTKAESGSSHLHSKRRQLHIVTSRPVRWPGDVHTVPKDVVAIMEGGSLHGTRGGGGGGGGVSSSVVALVVAVICIALTPLWNWVYKKLKRVQPPPCQEGCGPMAVSSLPDDKEMQAMASRFIETRMAALSEKQLELMKSVEVDMSEVTTKSLIGSGSFSLVYKGYYASSHIAIKVLKKVDEKNFRRFLDEIVLHKDLRHPNIIPFRGASWSDGRLLLLVDFAGRGTLADVLRRSNNQLKWNKVKLNIAIGIAKGMTFLHEARFYDLWTSTYQQCIVHRDLKPQNILITDSYHVQITDFGEARTLDRESTMTQVGTQLYAAPEVVRGERYSEKCDLYSFAVVLVAMLELKPDVLDVFAEYLNPIEKAETGITAERLKEPEDVEATDQCKTCPLNKHYQPSSSKCGGSTAKMGDTKEKCPLAKHKEFKGVVAHAVTRAVVYDDMRPRLPSHVFSTVRSLIERCWDKDPTERPSFKTVVDLLESEVLNEVSEYTRASDMRRQRGDFELTRRRADPLAESLASGRGGAVANLVGGGSAKPSFNRDIDGRSRLLRE